MPKEVIRYQQQEIHNCCTARDFIYSEFIDKCLSPFDRCQRCCCCRASRTMYFVGSLAIGWILLLEKVRLICNK